MLESLYSKNVHPLHLSKKASSWVMNEWSELSEQFASNAERHGAPKQFLALSKICNFLSTSKLGYELKPVEPYGGGGFRLTPSNGSFPTKTLRLQSIQGDRIEFALHDSATGVERYYHPHEPHDHALERFQEILRSIDWRKPVGPPSLMENVHATYKYFFTDRYKETA